MARETENRQLKEKHDENLLSESEGLKQEAHPHPKNTTKKKKGVTSAFSAATSESTAGEASDKKKSKRG